VHSQDRVHAVQVGDIDGDQGVDQRIVGQLDGAAPPQPPHELAVDGGVLDAEFEFVQRK